MRDDRGFEQFVESAGPRLRAALVAAYGVDGVEAAAEAVAYGWEHWDRLAEMSNPAGYLFRVGQSAARRGRRTPPVLPAPAHSEIPDFEPRLIPALQELPEQQRVCVMLVHAFGWRQVDVAELLDIDPASVRTHVNRALSKLQSTLEVTNDVH